VLGLGLALVGCTSAASNRGARVTVPTADAPRARDVARATELYFVGETAFAEGRYIEAVAIWRHALLSLPQEARYDDVRHELVLRMAYGLGVAYTASGDAAHLDDAERMLERYLAVHERLFGEDETAHAQRGEVYALLGDIAVARTESPPTVAEIDPGRTAAAVPSSSRPVDHHAGEVLEGDVTRDVVVDGNARPTVDDPAERAALKSSFGDAESAGLLTFPNDFSLHPERPLVRVRRWPRLAESADGSRARLRPWLAVVRAARPQLERCYFSAFSRQPHDVVDLTVEVTVEQDADRRRPSIVSGELVDALGDACVLDALAFAPSEELAALSERDRSRVRIELRFFWQPAAIGDGITGQSPSIFGGAVVDKAEYAMPEG